MCIVRLADNHLSSHILHTETVQPEIEKFETRHTQKKSRVNTTFHDPPPPNESCIFYFAHLTFVYLHIFLQNVHNLVSFELRTEKSSTTTNTHTHTQTENASNIYMLIENHVLFGRNACDVNLPETEFSKQMLLMVKLFDYHHHKLSSVDKSRSQTTQTCTICSELTKLE